MQGLGSVPDVPHADYVSGRKTEGNGVGINKEPPVSVKGQDVVGIRVVQRGGHSSNAVSHLCFTVSLIGQQVKWDTLFISKTLVIEIPPGNLPDGSKESFVMLLEYAEEKLCCKKVIVCFKKSSKERETLIRTFMFLGFVLVSPGTHQLARSNDRMYMSYSIDADDEDDDDDDDESDLESEAESDDSA